MRFIVTIKYFGLHIHKCCGRLALARYPAANGICKVNERSMNIYGTGEYNIVRIRWILVLVGPLCLFA